MTITELHTLDLSKIYKFKFYYGRNVHGVLVQEAKSEKLYLIVPSNLRVYNKPMSVIGGIYY